MLDEVNIEQLHGQSFNWLTWRAGNLTEMLNLRTREDVIVSNKNTIRKYAIGWCPSESLVCRPKINEVGVMFLTKDIEWWTHFRIKEFLVCFPELKNYFNDK